jgi:branched-subunit amino acid transport protein
MNLGLILVIAVITYGTRALALVAMPDPSPSLRRLLDRLPAPLFASLAAISLFDEGGLVDAPTLAAAAGALAFALTRSLLIVLLGGLVGYVLMSFI